MIDHEARTDIKNRDKKTAEMLLTKPEHIRKFESIVDAKSRSKPKKRIKCLREDRKGSVEKNPLPRELQPPVRQQEHLASAGATPTSSYEGKKEGQFAIGTSMQSIQSCLSLCKPKSKCFAPFPKNVPKLIVLQVSCKSWDHFCLAFT